ncbi:hypothetical protein DYB36_003412 [Aphanomyces astaci]|uniref:Uncharacterized protein n=1 Tax=Aphanomyces astaci TaxID=112090 RepID=A0A396ZU84_APHAT|nr:hypothetical protein DYB36_003412 [Aphanomyces astaci]
MEGNTVLYVMRESMTLNSVPLVPDAIRGRVKSLSLHTECPNGTIEHVICGNCAIFIPRPKEQLFQTHLSVVKEEYCKTCYLHVRGPTSSSMTSSSSIGGGATFMLSSRHFPKDSETTYQSNRSLLSMPTSRRGYKTPSTKQATLSMIPPLRG